MIIVGIVAFAAARASHACVGLDCMQIWSSEPGGGELVLRYDFVAKNVQTYLSFPPVCTSETASCLYTAIDPGFMAPPAEENPGEVGYHALVDGTKVTLVIAPPDGQTIPADEGVALQLNGRRLSRTGDSATVGTMPNIHNHPSWQVNVPGGEFGEYRISFRLTSDSAAYADSPVYTAIITNVAPPPQSPTPTPSPRPTPTGRACWGDCDGNGTVNVNEIVRCVNISLERSTMEECPACDPDRDQRVMINELVGAVNATLGGCITPPQVTLAEIQADIFTPTCATRFCHDAAAATAGLVLDAENAYEQLVGVPPTTFSANAAGLLRVAAGDPGKSFLLVKLEGPPPDQGSRMPLTFPPLSSEQLDLVRAWIEQGAVP